MDKETMVVSHLGHPLSSRPGSCVAFCSENGQAGDTGDTKGGPPIYPRERLPSLLPGPPPLTDLMTSSSVQASGRFGVWGSVLSRAAACTGVVSEEDTPSAWYSLKGLWRWVGLLLEALLLARSEAVERGPLTVSVRSPSGGAGVRRCQVASGIPRPL